MIRVVVSYTGRVQGVGFRATAVRCAERFEVSGWVRNEPNGGVTLVAEGASEEVDGLLDEVARTMKGCIRGVDRREEPPIGEQGFGVRR
ncbi:MAG TPA: acylphosphatase [Phycisphaerales bacterium]|nr:acylphosphatase [Phycisphaerales bacterium]